MKLQTMKNMLLSLGLSALMPLSTMADDVVTFRVSGPDGAVKEYVLDDISRLAFDAESFTMVFNTGAADEEFRYDDVLNMQFGSKSGTGVQNVAEDEGISIKFYGDMLRINGCEGTSVMSVYDISGRPVLSQRITGSADISTDNLSAGVYILKINNKTFKFSKL